MIWRSGFDSSPTPDFSKSIENHSADQAVGQWLKLGENSTRHFCHDLELHGGDLISSPVDSIVSLVLPKKSYGPNSVGKNYFSATPFSLLAKNATGGHNA